MHDDGTPGGTMRQVKVDNWGIFFLQRLQQFFNRGDHCDLVLLFGGNVKIKVHRLVLNACTEYFQALENRIGVTKDNCLRMPSDLSAEVVQPIINFMYTGRLEFRDSLTKKLYYTAGRLNMPVLTKLLDAQASSDLAEPSVPTSTPSKQVALSLNSKSTNTTYSPAKKIGMKELPETLPGRKLPIWKKRRAPFILSTSSYEDSGPAESAAMAPEETSPVNEEPARPTRFEWPEDEETLKTYTPPFDSITYESTPLQVPSLNTPKPLPPTPAPQKKATFEDLQARYQPLKRTSTSTLDTSTKKSKMDIQSVKEYLQEQEVRKGLVCKDDEGEDEMGEGGIALGDVAEDDDDDDDDRDMDQSLTCEVEGEELVNDESGLEAGLESISSTPQHHKSILKHRLSEEPSTASKKVRFSLAGQEAQEQTLIETEEFSADLGEGTSELQTSTGSNNHAKIISEVLKKYPHLVRDNKNIRLKIMQRGSVPSDPDSKFNKVSYVVLKAGEAMGKNRTPAKVIVKSGGRIEHISGIINPDQNTKPPSGAENTTGPWLCFSCGTNEEPITFETYFSYRRHLQDIHNEKIDARICEHCGHRASKRNLLLYHLYTKHSIPPPRNCQFPKCDQCDYVALSESLLIKHRNNHSNAKDYVCKVCNASFKSNGALQGHMQTNLHSDPDKKKYECPYCRKPFVRNINLKAHVRTAHKDVERKLEEEVNNFDMRKKKTRKDIALLRSKDGHTEGESSISTNSPPPSLEPSSEAEALSNVASGIAASLGLADQLAEVEHQVVQTSVAGPDGTCQTFIISALPGQEYIVPEMLTNANGEPYQIATSSSLADLVQYDASNLGAVVSSFARTSGQQTIVITTAPSSGGHEHLKLITAEGTTINAPLDQVTLLTGQNLLVGQDASGVTESATEGYQAILQPNGVLTLQPVGAHMLQSHGGDVSSEEGLVQHGYVTEDGTIMTLQAVPHGSEGEPPEHNEQTELTECKPMVIEGNDGQIEIDTQNSTILQSVQPAQESIPQPSIVKKTKKISMPIKPKIIGTPLFLTSRKDSVHTDMTSRAQPSEVAGQEVGRETQILEHHAEESHEIQAEVQLPEQVMIETLVEAKQEVENDVNEEENQGVIEEVHHQLEMDDQDVVQQEKHLEQEQSQDLVTQRDECKAEEPIELHNGEDQTSEVEIAQEIGLTQPSDLNDEDSQAMQASQGITEEDAIEEGEMHQAGENSEEVEVAQLHLGNENLNESVLLEDQDIQTEDQVMQTEEELQNGEYEEMQLQIVGDEQQENEEDIPVESEEREEGSLLIEGEESSLATEGGETVGVDGEECSMTMEEEEGNLVIEGEEEEEESMAIDSEEGAMVIDNSNETLMLDEVESTIKEEEKENPREEEEELLSKNIQDEESSGLEPQTLSLETESEVTATNTC